MTIYDTSLFAGATTCLEYRALQEKLTDYWKTPKGITRRIDSLSQNFNYLIVNNAFKVIAPVNGAHWMRWVDMGDDHVCDICLSYASGGRGGFYHVTWFMPEMPVHDGCRCQWEIWFEDPFT